MKLRARIPDGERYLVVPDDTPDRGALPDETPTRVLDAAAGVLHEPRPFGSIVARDPYYETYDPEEGEIERLLEGVDARGPPADEIGEYPENIDQSETDTTEDEETGQEEEELAAEDAESPGVVDLSGPRETDWLREARDEDDTE